jgi:hypothetical protein
MTTRRDSPRGRPRKAAQAAFLARLRDKGLGLAPIVSKPSGNRPAARAALGAPIAIQGLQGPITREAPLKPADRLTAPPSVGQVFEFVVDAPCEFLNANRDKGHWGATSKKVKAWRGAGYRAAVRAALPVGLARVQVDCFVRKPIANRFDPANWAPTAKAVLDGMVSDYGLTEDDNRHFVTGPFMHDGGKGENALTVRVTVLASS